MWAADRVRAEAVPLKVYGVNGRGRSEPLYFKLPWQKKFPWLQGFLSMLCQNCCCLQPQPASIAKGDKRQCISCGAWISPEAAAITVRCPVCHGETLWDSSASRLDCRICGRHVAKSPKYRQRR
eukprot:TRINITY_DN22853_c0_g1_i1.p2 TRINITY_DN22853_c0_g1~~TRINITY_DN22853_c0_g1_i1.p2  ORF type:complete len:124 (+),score=16.53 TRINITY_DN22853_c0_g1_i1:1-372(+)